MEATETPEKNEKKTQPTNWAVPCNSEEEKHELDLLYREVVHKHFMKMRKRVRKYDIVKEALGLLLEKLEKLEEKGGQ